MDGRMQSVIIRTPVLGSGYIYRNVWDKRKKEQMSGIIQGEIPSNRWNLIL